MRAIFDKTYTVALANNSGPAVVSVPLNLPDSGTALVEGWIGNFGSSNAYLFGGTVPLSECQQRITNPGIVNCLFALTASGPVRTECDVDDIRGLTVFFEADNTSGQTETVTVRVRISE